MTKILLIHGPNLNLLGEREPASYGMKTSQTILEDLKKEFPNIELDYVQSNSESDLVDAIQASSATFHGILINAGAFSHTSIAIADALRSIKLPAISVHLTNIYQREGFRHSDIIGEACQGAIVGLGTDGYALALECLLEKLY
ncbi:MAG: type II 3-dehydroquinate dehydratase [Bacteroidia bacterium]